MGMQSISNKKRRRDEMRVVLSGYYGFGNVGDESVLKAIIKGLRKIIPKVNITVLSATPKLTKEFNGVDSISRNNCLKIIIKLLKAKYFISGGGTLFQNVTSTRSLYYYLGLILLAKLLFRKVIVMAQGFGPLTGRINRLVTRFVLNRANLITLRDSNSYDELVKLGVKKSKIKITADPAIILDKPGLEQGRKVLSLEAVRLNKPLLGIAVRSVPLSEEEGFYKTLSGAVDWLVKNYNYAPVFVLFQCPEDMAETSKIINYMQEKSNVIFRICQPNEMMSLIANFDLLIGMRLHSLIFAAMNHVPMLGLSYDPKVKAFMNEIEQPDLEVSHDLDLRSTKNTLEEIINNKDDIKKALASKLKQLKIKAQDNFTPLCGS